MKAAVLPTRSSPAIHARDSARLRRAQQALRILSDVSAVLSEALDCDTALAKVARSLVPAMGDGCAIQLIEGGELRTAASAGTALQRAEPASGQAAGSPVGGEDGRGVYARVIRTGLSELLSDDGPASGTREAVDSLLFRTLGARALVVAALRMRGQTLGVIVLGSNRRAYDGVDRDLVEQIASRVACAVEHARLQRDADSQRTRLRLIADASKALAAELDVQGVARSFAQVMRSGVLVALEAPDGSFVVRACTSIDENVERRLQPLVGLVLGLQPGTIAEEVLRRREPQVLGASAVERLRPPFSTLASELGLGSLIVAPLLVRGRPIGIMSAFRAVEFEALGREDLGLVEDIADRAAVAFERARLFEGQLRATERLRLLADAGTLLAQSLEVDPTLMNLARLAVQRFAHLCAVHLLEEGRVTSVAVAAAEGSLEAECLAAIEGYSRATCAPPALRAPFESGSAVLIRSLSREALRDFAVNEAQFEALAALGIESMVIAPLMARGGPVGVLSLARTHGPPYDRDDLAIGEELARRAALAVDNAQLFRRATEAIAVRDEFLAIASHELNTPLTPLKMQLDSLRRAKFSPKRTAEKLDGASRQVTRLSKLVRELLDVSRISGGRLRIEPERFDLAGLVGEIVGRMSDEAEHVGVHLSYKSAHPLFGSWDRMRVDQVLTNLLTNAIKYGEGRPVEIEVSNPGARARIVVRDHGIGIAPEHQRRIFERFERAASARHYGGFGIGLWIARQIVEASGGTIAVESAPGAGSTFTVDLPISGG
jgi:signal transduction histidine kinase